MRRLFLTTPLWLAACGPTAEPRWVPLARGFAPQPLFPLVQRWHADEDESDRIFEVLHGVQLEHLVRAEDWKDDGEGRWSTPFGAGAFAYGIPGFLQVELDGASLAPENQAAGKFSLEAGCLRITLAPGEAPPALLKVSQRFESGRPGPNDSWQVRLGEVVSAGIPVWSGAREELACDVPARSALCFQARWTSRLAPEPVLYRVRRDGQTVFEERIAPAELEHGAFRSVELPRGPARLAFEVEGQPGLGVFYGPVIGPEQEGVLGARPWEGARPDIVLFLADTLRADGLACYGGDPGLAPHLNAFAARSLRCLRARAPAAWTLPSISSLFSGLAPGQHGATGKEEGLPGELETITELLARAGYRTGAITDGGYFTHNYGLDQGFEWFQQRDPTRWDLARTLEEARAFLERDDGRPLFLVVHTYRTHMPYRVGERESREDWAALQAEGYALLNRDDLEAGEGLRLLRESAPRYRELYREGVRALDAGFGRFLAALEAHRFLEHGYLLFLSDHGEALGENDDIFHAGALWEVKLRIPLLVAGPGIAPRDLAHTATLLDVAPTLAGLARIPAAPDWPGASLLALAVERPAFAFRFEEHAPEVAILDGQRKLFSAKPSELERGRCSAAYDLAQDPGEERNLAHEESWPAELARRWASQTLAQLESRARPLEVRLSPEQHRELEGIGY
jgi:arylsulfatase A-like enzyme